VFERVQTTLQRNGRSGGVEVRNRHGALLKRLLRCTACGTATAPAASPPKVSGFLNTAG
jgi:hypothetical protein